MFDAVEARDRALAEIGEHGDGWAYSAIAALRTYIITHPSFIGEEFRLWAAERVGQPHHHNAWGAVMRVAAQMGIIRMTDRQRPTTTKRSHARRSPVWEVV